MGGQLYRFLWAQMCVLLAVGSRGQKGARRCSGSGWTRAMWWTPISSSCAISQGVCGQLSYEPRTLDPWVSQDHKMGGGHGLPGSGDKTQSLRKANLAFHKTTGTWQPRGGGRALLSWRTLAGESLAAEGGTAGWGAWGARGARDRDRVWGVDCSLEARAR